MPTPASTNGTKHAAGYWDGLRKDRPRLDPAYLPVLTGAMTDSISDLIAAQGINIPEPADPDIGRATGRARVGQYEYIPEVAETLTKNTKQQAIICTNTQINKIKH